MTVAHPQVVLRLLDFWPNWNLEMLVFEERGKPEYPEKKLLGARERTNYILNPLFRLFAWHVKGNR